MLKSRIWKTVESVKDIPTEIVLHHCYANGDFWMSFAKISLDGIVEIYFDDKSMDRWESNPTNKKWVLVNR